MFQNLIIGKVNFCTDPIEDPVTLQCGGVAVGQVGTAFSTTLVAGGGVPPYSFSITDGALPAGLELDGNTGEISGTPTVGGSFSFTAKVVDSVGTTGIYTASIECGIGVTPNPLEAGCVANAIGQVGQPYSAALTASGGIAPYTFAIGGGTLPDGLELDPQTGVISGQPLVAGNFTFTVSVVDQVGTGYSQAVSAECSIVIEPPCVPLALQCASTAVGTVGSAYSAAFPVEGGVAPFTFSVESGMLPPGLELNLATGHLEGIPTSAGVFNFSVSVVDSSGSACGGNQSASVSCGITVESECPPIALGCVSVATGKVGTAYVSGLSVAGGIAPYTFSIISGNLPAGLSLNPATGAITGTPTVAGTFQFTAKVRSASSVGTPPSGAAQTVTVGSSYGCNSRVSVTFYGCSSTVDVSSTKDLSNVVLQTCDGTRYKFEVSSLLRIGLW